MGFVFVVVTVLIFVVPLMLGSFVVKSKRDDFVSLGDIRGRPIDEIVAVVGNPTSVSAAADGGTLYQWISVSGSSSYHYAIIVDADAKAQGYTHQFVS